MEWIEGNKWQVYEWIKENKSKKFIFKTSYVITYAVGDSGDTLRTLVSMYDCFKEL